nr:proteasome subunit beta [Halobacterium wangiae]
MVNTHQSNTATARDPRQGWPPIHEADPSTLEAAPAPVEDSVAETGTTVVGLTTADGVVMAADRRASVGGRLVTNKRTQKVEQLHPTAAAALSGAVGHIQQFVRVLRAEARLYENRRSEDLTMTALATLAGNVLRSAPLQVTPLLGGVDEDGGHVFSLDGGGGVLSDSYAAGGSGMQLAYGVLEQHFEDDLTAEAGRSVAAQAIASASERDTASGNGLTVATITSEGVAFDEFDGVSEVA